MCPCVGVCITAWCSEIGSLTSLDALELYASSDVRAPRSLHQAVCVHACACVCVCVRASLCCVYMDRVCVYVWGVELHMGWYTLWLSHSLAKIPVSFLKIS